MYGIILGSVGYHPNEKHQTSCVMLPELGVVFDAGTGFFRVGRHLRTETLHVFLSHYHWDHVIGLDGLIDVFHESRGKLKELHIYGIPPVQETVERIFENPFFPVPLSALPFQTFFHDWDPSPRANVRWRVGNAQVRPKWFRHPTIGSLGFRLEVGGKVLVYVTDTTVTDEVVPLAEGADLFICECYFPNAMKALALKTGHTYPRLAARVAKAAKVKKLLLFHAGPLLDERGRNRLRNEVKEIFSGPVAVAEDRQKFSF